MPRVTIADVARKAGVSPTTVSFTFNRPTELSPTTVRKVLKAAEELGYVPNPHARALLSSRAGVLGLLVPERIFDAFANPFYAAFVQGMGLACERQNLSLMIVSPIEGSLEKAISRAPADGFVILGLGEDHRDISPLSRRKVPFVIVDGDAELASSVNSDDETGAHQAASCLLSRGHRDLVILTFLKPHKYLHEPYHDVGERRLRGYRRAYEEYDVIWSEDLVIPPPCSIEGGERCFEKIWQSGQRPTAVLCMSDALALGVLRAAERLGLRVPEDLEVVGFDDVPQAALARPSLTTVRQPIVEKGRSAAQLLASALDDNQFSRHILLPTELVLRRTTSC